MAFSSGTFSLYSPGNPVVTGTTISSTWANSTLSDIATGLSTCVLKDGTQTITANIPMSTYKLTGLGAGSANGDSLRYEQVFTSGLVTLLGTLKAPTTIGVGAATPAASGSGVSFPASQSSSTDVNTLDDYEEGTWSPTVASSAGAIVSSTVNSAIYTKIGRLVKAIVDLTITDVGTGSGTLNISLPFTAASVGVGCGRNITSGNQLQGFVSGSSATSSWVTYNNGFPVGNENARVEISYFAAT